MISIIENNGDYVILKKYPTKQWFVFFCVTISLILLNYSVLFNAPIYSTLTCDRGWFNTVNCELVESALLKPNLRHKTINKIGDSQHILKNGRILLNTEIDLLHNRIKNNYFPSHSFLGFSDIYLYRFRGQALNEVKQIKNFVHGQDKEYRLKITRKIFPLFYLLLILFPTTILIGIFSILIQPIKTYTFDFQQNCLMVLEKSIFASDDRTHLIDKLLITSVDEEKGSILLKTNSNMSYLLNEFENEQEALKIINTLKQHIK